MTLGASVTAAPATAATAPLAFTMNLRRSVITPASCRNGVSSRNVDEPGIPVPRRSGLLWSSSAFLPRLGETRLNELNQQWPALLSPSHLIGSRWEAGWAGVYPNVATRT